nr:ribosomal protein S6 kinase alpha 4 [Hymenolepis microstoma]
MAKWNEKFSVSDYLGKGAYSIVFDVVSTSGPDEGKHYALKRFFLKDPCAVRTAIRELKILQRFANEKPDCKQLPTIYYSFIHSGSPCIVMKLLSRHTLLSLVGNFFYLTEYDVAFYAAEILHGLEQIHSMGIVHMDIREKNILVTESGHLVISDFDRAYDLSITHAYNNLRFILPGCYSAPEIEKSFCISTKADIWSFGIVLKEMLNVTFDPSVTLKDLVSRCLTEPIHDRPTAKELKNHPIFGHFDWGGIAAWSYPPPLLPSSLPYEFGDEVEQLKSFLKYNPTTESAQELMEKSTEVQNQAFLTQCAFGKSPSFIIKMQELYLSEDGTQLIGRTLYADSVLQGEELHEYMNYFKEYQSTNPKVETKETETETKHS